MYIKYSLIGLFLLSSVSFAECCICNDLLSLIKMQTEIYKIKYNVNDREILYKYIEIYKNHLGVAHGKEL